VLSDLEIIALAELGMITPFVDTQVRVIEHRESIIPAISFGLSGYGYDARLSDQDVWVSKSAAQTMSYDKARRDAFLRDDYAEPFSDLPLEINPKDFTVERHMKPGVIDEDRYGRYFHIPARGFCLCRSIERFVMPPHVTALVFEKSTTSRAGLSGLMTPAEAGWAGHYVFEFTNPWDIPFRMSIGEGIAQFVFFEGSPAAMPYHMRKSPKYQDQVFMGPRV